MMNEMVDPSEKVKISAVPAQDTVEAFQADLASLRARVGGALRMPFEEDLQRLSNRRHRLELEFTAMKKTINAIVTEHHSLSPQLRLRVLGTS